MPSPSCRKNRSAEPGPVAKDFPEERQWNAYWSRDQTQRFTRISWSKRRIMAVLRPHLRPGISALDAGCGSGFFANYFCDEGLRVTALDYAESALEIARAITKGRCQLMRKDLSVAGLSREIAQRYDLIFSDGLLEHFTPGEQDTICQNFISVLAPGGIIVTIVPNRYSPWEIIRPLYMPGIHERPFTLKELIDWNTRNDLTVLQSGGLNTFPWAISPDRVCGAGFGMLLYTIATKR